MGKLAQELCSVNSKSLYIELNYFFLDFEEI